MHEKYRLDEEQILQLPKQNNYYYRIIDDVCVLYYKMSEYLFNKHITYCRENNIIPTVNERWITILIDSDKIGGLEGFHIGITPAHCSFCKRKAEYWYIGLSKKRKTTSIGRILLDCATSSLHVDHKDNDTFNCLITNMQLVTQKQNNENKRLFKKTESGARGVYVAEVRHPYGVYKYWVAQVSHNGKNVYNKKFPYTAEGLKNATSAAQEARNKYFINNLKDDIAP